jgi:IS1 family transposase
MPCKETGILEVDEIFSCINLKINQIRIWIVQSRRTRQILSFFIGDGSMDSCKRLWANYLLNIFIVLVFLISGNLTIAFLK